MCWKNAFWFCWCAFFWTSSRAALDAQQKPVQSITKLDCARKFRSETENNASETSFLSFTPPCPRRKGRQVAEWFAARGGNAAHTESSLLSAHKKRHLCIRSLLHTVCEGDVSWEPAAGGHNYTLRHTLLLSPQPLIIESHNSGSQKPIWPSLRKNSLTSDLTDLAFSAEKGSLACGHSYLVLWEFT